MMTTSMTMTNPMALDQNNDLDWSALVPVGIRPARQTPTAPAARMTSSEIEQADYEAARQLGEQRRVQAGRPTNPAAGNAQSKNTARGWLQDDPRQWRGRKIRSRSNQAIYTIRQVFNSGRVELEKTFMLFNSNVETIRKDYITA